MVRVPFFRPDLGDAEIEEVVDTLRSGWLTTGPRVRRFEEAFAREVGARHAVAVNSCTAAMHLAVAALGLRRGQGVLVPTMTYLDGLSELEEIELPAVSGDRVHSWHLFQIRLRSGRLPALRGGSGAPALRGGSGEPEAAAMVGT